MSTPDLVSTFASASLSGSSPGRPDDLTNGVRSSMAVGADELLEKKYRGMQAGRMKRRSKGGRPATLKKFRH
jgi:hypothetical protein